jgi:hypothetical protein
MSRNSEFAKARPKQAVNYGMRFHARRVAKVLETTKDGYLPSIPVVPYPTPGRGQSGESSN